MIIITTPTQTYEVPGCASDVHAERTGLHIKHNGQTIATFRQWTNWMEKTEGDSNHG